MSRLENHYRKQIRQRVLIFSGIFVLCVILFFTIGLPLLLNGSISLSNLFTGKKDDTDQRNPVLQTIDIDPIPEAVNKAELSITGRAINFDSIQVYVNGSKVAEDTLSDTGEFAEDVNSLHKGTNEIYVIAKAKGQEKRSDTFTVVYQSEKPKLEISEPQDNSTTDKEEISVKGTTAVDNAIKVSDSPVVVDANGAFQTTVKLKEGENKIKVTAEDDTGNIEEKTLTVKYEK